MLDENISTSPRLVHARESSIRIRPGSFWYSNTRVIKEGELKQIETAFGNNKEEKNTSILPVYRKNIPVTLLNTPDDSVVSKGLKPCKKIETYCAAQDGKFVINEKKCLFNSTLKLSDFRNQFDSTKMIRTKRLVTTLKDNSKIVRKKKISKIEFKKGQSKRICKELFKVLDLSDLIIEVIDARNPLGTRCHYIEKYIKNQSPHKYLIILLNKCDLVPSYITKGWLHLLSKEFPTVAFHSSLTNPLGKGALLSVLRQISNLRRDKSTIKACFVGYPNVGKSSVINALKTKEVCKTAQRPGETKVWQFVVLMKKLFLLDCPGFVHDETRESEVETILNGVTRVEKLSDASIYIPTLLHRTRPEYLQRAYQIRKWSNPEDFIFQLAARSGKILKGGELDIEASAKTILSDYQRGINPCFVRTPEHYEKKPDTNHISSNSDSNIAEMFGMHSQKTFNNKYLHNIESVQFKDQIQGSKITWEEIAQN